MVSLGFSLGCPSVRMWRCICVQPGDVTKKCVLCFGRWISVGCWGITTGWKSLAYKAAYLSLLTLSEFDIECNVELHSLESNSHS